MRMLPCLLLAACTQAAAPPQVHAPAPEPEAVEHISTLDPALEPLRGLIGAWEGGDPERHSTGRFTLKPDLFGKVLVRRNSNDSPKGRHEDLMIVFHAQGGLRASYFDNEGLVIEYAIVASGDHIEMLSDEVPNQPRFKLSYDLHGTGELAIDFSMAMPGSTEFKHYTGGVVHRVRS